MHSDRKPTFCLAQNLIIISCRFSIIFSYVLQQGNVRLCVMPNLREINIVADWKTSATNALKEH